MNTQLYDGLWRELRSGKDKTEETTAPTGQYHFSLLQFGLQNISHPVFSGEPQA